MGVSEPLIQASLLGEAAEHAPFAVLVADEEGRYVAVNQAACLMLGYSREELLRLGMRDVARYAEAAGEFDDLVDAGSMPEARSRGKVRIEGKDYVMQDGDVVEFRFNV